MLRRPVQKDRVVRVVGARANNLKNIDAAFPLGTFTCVTGVSGGGKSTLVVDTLYKAAARRLMGSGEVPAPHDRIEGLEQLDKIIDIDQSPIGRTPRSNPATYTDLFAPIRDWFAELPEFRARGYKPGRFSFNVKGGRCEACQGDGLLKIEMHFLPDVYVTCDTCKGRRYNRETLEIKFRDKSIAEVLAMTVDEAVPYFSAQTRIHDRLKILQQVGLGYIALGQQATTLSGGEAQRIKLSKELARRATGRTLYILDEPTTGLHFEDVRKLLEVLHALVDQGNTVIVIEHNLEVIKTADWILDLGPEGGDGGGRIVAEGTPEDIAANPDSHTGRFLAPLLMRPRPAEGAAPGVSLDRTNGVATDTASGAAIQAAIWEIENKSGATGYDVTLPKFTASVNSDAATFATDIQTYLSNVSGTNGSNGIWQPTAGQSVMEYSVVPDGGANQSFGFLSLTGGGGDISVPEPASLGLCPGHRRADGNASQPESQPAGLNPISGCPNGQPRSPRPTATPRSGKPGRAGRTHSGRSGPVERANTPIPAASARSSPPIARRNTWSRLPRRGDVCAEHQQVGDPRHLTVHPLQDRHMVAQRIRQGMAVSVSQ